MAKRKSAKGEPIKHTHKAKYRVTRTPLQTGVNSGDPEGLKVPAPLVALIVLLL